MKRSLKVICMLACIAVLVGCKKDKEIASLVPIEPTVDKNLILEVTYEEGEQKSTWDTIFYEYDKTKLPHLLMREIHHTDGSVKKGDTLEYRYDGLNRLFSMRGDTIIYTGNTAEFYMGTYTFEGPRIIKEETGILGLTLTRTYSYSSDNNLISSKAGDNIMMYIRAENAFPPWEMISEPLVKASFGMNRGAGFLTSIIYPETGISQTLYKNVELDDNNYVKKAVSLMNTITVDWSYKTINLNHYYYYGEPY